MPEVGELPPQLGGSKYFIELHLKSGFHQNTLKEEDREKTAFAVNYSLYVFTRLPFGFISSPAIFRNVIDDILGRI